MSIVTRSGDDGTTGLVGGKRVSKSDLRLHATGTVDEVNALLGAAIAGGIIAPYQVQLGQVQHLLFRLGSDLSTPLTNKPAMRIAPEHTALLDQWIREMENILPPLTAFILPGGTGTAARLHVARTVCRRAERWVVTLATKEHVNTEALVFLNRLSDYLFLVARAVNRTAGTGEEQVEY